MVVLLVLKCMSRRSSSFIAYKCEDDTLEVTSICLRDDVECTKPELTYRSEKRDIVELQRNELKMRWVQTGLSYHIVAGTAKDCAVGRLFCLMNKSA